MAFLESKVKGEIPVGATVGGAPAFSVLKPGADGNVLVSDSTQPEGWKVVPASSISAAVDPRDIFRFSMFHNVGVTGGG